MTSTPSFAALTGSQLAEVIGLLPSVDSVELKLSVPDVNLRSATTALGMDPLDAQLRQVVFFDTPDLALDRLGVVLRARRIQGKPGDVVVKLRPIRPESIPKAVRKDPSFSVEIDALPGGFTCSGTMKHQAPDAEVKAVMLGTRPVRSLLTEPQLALYGAHATDDLDVDTLRVLGPINVMKLKWKAPEIKRRLVAELWFYPDGGRILELSTKCAPADAFTAAAETKGYLATHGIDLTAEQQTKTRTALTFFANELSGS